MRVNLCLRSWIRGVRGIRGGLVAPSVLLAVLAAVAWSGRWEPVLDVRLQDVRFYLETQPELPEGVAAEPPVVNCAARVRVRNAGRGAVETPGHPGTAPGLLPRVEWDPPRPREDGLSCWVSGGSVVLRPGEEAEAAAFTHLPEGAGTDAGLDRIRLRVILEAYRPASWRAGVSEWVLRKVNLGPRVNDWLLGLLEREPRLVASPWFEAEVPDVASLGATAAP